MGITATRRTTARTLPLGIDLGASRVRVALAQRNNDGTVDLLAVATRDHENDPSRALVDAVTELRPRERRCVFGLGEPSAMLRTTRFPPMRQAEQDRAAHFEAMKFIDYPIDDATVRVVPRGSDGQAVIGVVRKAAIAVLITAAHAAKLRVSAVDNNGFAYRRALGSVDAVLDIGLTDTRLHILTGDVPLEHRFEIGGAAFTGAVATALGCDEPTAERRKRTFGIAGCGELLRDLLVREIASALVESRFEGTGDVRSIALVGNGSRLADFGPTLERATSIEVQAAALEPSVSGRLPADVLRAAGSDWALAYGLALWSQR